VTRARPDDLVSVPGAPAIAGLLFRRLRGKEDFEGMAEAISSGADADGGRIAGCGRGHWEVEEASGAYSYELAVADFRAYEAEEGMGLF
jgi:hypothetical protein